MPSDETHFVHAGLTAQEAEARLGKFGPNEPAATQQHSFRSDLLHQFMNLLVLILIIAAVASGFLGEKSCLLALVVASLYPTCLFLVSIWCLFPKGTRET
jgi:P-type Ca2+ transporter type 2C